MISKEEQRGDLHIVTVTDTGRSHSRNQIPNQDAVLYSFIGEDFALAVSDGVGSCQMAEIGSKKAVQAVLTTFKAIRGLEYDKSEIPQRVILEWKKQLGDVEIDDCCTTLKVAIKINDQIMLASIGDGMLVMTSNGFKVKAPTEEMQFANQTRCMSSYVQPWDFWLEEFRLDANAPYAIFICTDGIANGIKDGSEYEFVKEIEDNTSSEKLKDELELFAADISNFSSDDRTLGVVKYERKNAESQQ